MDYKHINLDEIVFLDDFLAKERSFAIRYFRFILVFIIPSFIVRIAPIRFPKELDFKKNEFAYLCKVSGLEEVIDQEDIEYFQKRTNALHLFERIFLYSFQIPSILITFGIFFGGIYFLSETHIQASTNETTDTFIKGLVGVIIYILIFLSFLVIGNLTIKLIAVLTSKRFADINSINAILFLIIELGRKNVLSQKEKKRILQLRLNFLAVNTRYLQFLNPDQNSRNQQWINEHFKRLELYIRERERWTAAPTETTLVDLRRDFYNLAKIYLSGRFGEFDWSSVKVETETPTTPLKQKILLAIPKFIGIMLPLTGLGYLLINPSLIPTTLNKDIVQIVFIAWFLLSLDATLKLGVVSGVVSLAKEIKNLK